MGASSSWCWANTFDSPITLGCFVKDTICTDFWLILSKRNVVSCSSCPSDGVKIQNCSCKNGILKILTGVPLIPCALYAILRLMNDDKMCWALPASDSYVEWIYMAPGLACILANFIFFINIFRILLTKLRAPHANEPAHFRKAVKATVVLLPLFGLHCLLTLYRPQTGHCIWILFYKYLNLTLDGTQGLMVAIAFCYRNGEVRKNLYFSAFRCFYH